MDFSYKVKRPLKWYEKLLKKFKIKIDEIEHDFIYGSRRVIKNEYLEDCKNHYDNDVWGEIKEELVGKIPEGFTVYGEIVGFTSNGKTIQECYDYGCDESAKEKKFYVYRITYTNDKGLVYNLSTHGIINFCKKYELNTVPYLYIGKLGDLFPELNVNDNWHENLLWRLEEEFKIEEDCYMCRNAVPREGIVIRKEFPFDFEAFKLKGFRFLERETRQLDLGKNDLESEN